MLGRIRTAFNQGLVRLEMRDIDQANNLADRSSHSLPSSQSRMSRAKLLLFEKAVDVEGGTLQSPLVI